MAIVSPVSPRCTEPLWRPVRRLNRAGIPEKYLSWLLDPASLTERLIGHCRQHFHVQLLDHARASAVQQARGRHAARYACRGSPGAADVWRYAVGLRAPIIPPPTLARKFHPSPVSARVLREVLFADPSMQRSEVEVTCLTPTDLPTAWQCAICAPNLR
jgi:hypothetical protein